MNKQQQIGRSGEELAARYLSRLGWRLLARNYHTRFGELDIVARDGRVLVFVEVKTRLSLAFGSPAEAINRKKQQHLIQAARVYLQEQGYTGEPVRFDVVTVYLQKQFEKIELFKNAFGATDSFWF